MAIVSAESRDAVPEDFFDPPRPPTGPGVEHWGLRHPWREPPENVMPGATDLAVLVARTRDAAVLVHEVSAWPAGLRFTLRVRLRRGSEAGDLLEDPILAYEVYARRRWRHRKDIPAEQLRFGLRLPGGARITNLSPGAPPGPFLTEAPGGGAEGEWVYLYAAYPLPGPGVLWFVCEWPALGIGPSAAAVDTTPIRAAAARAVTLW